MKINSALHPEVQHANKWEPLWQVKEVGVTVKLEDGCLTLEGQLPLNYQKDAVLCAINYLTGVNGVTNTIKIKSEIHDGIENINVKDAFGGYRSIDITFNKVTVSGTMATFTGTANSWYQGEEAARIAWNTSGISHAENELVVEYDFTYVD